MVNQDGLSKAKFVKRFHEKARAHIWKRRVSNMPNFPIREKGKVHLRKDKFPTLRKFKFLPRGDRFFKVLQRINDNAYVLDMPQDYEGSAIFNFDTNLGRHEEHTKDTENLDNKALQGPMTRGRLKRLEKEVQEKMGLLIMQGGYTKVIVNQLTCVSVVSLPFVVCFGEYDAN
ncbi:hypothetical protein CR513_09782, partial [Mucuna pruriens]